MKRQPGQPGEGEPQRQTSVIARDPQRFFAAVKRVLSNDSDVVYMEPNNEPELDAIGTLSSIEPPALNHRTLSIVSQLEQAQRGTLNLNGGKIPLAEELLKVLRERQEELIEKLVRRFEQMNPNEFVRPLSKTPDLRGQAGILYSKLKLKKTLTPTQKQSICRIMAQLNTPGNAQSIEDLRTIVACIRELETLLEQERIQQTRESVVQTTKGPHNMWGEKATEDDTDPFRQSHGSMSDLAQASSPTKDRRQGAPDPRPPSQRIERRRTTDRRQTDRQPSKIQPKEMPLPERRLFLVPAGARDLGDLIESTISRRRTLDDGSLLIEVHKETRLFYDQNRRLYLMPPGTNKAARLPQGTNIGRRSS